MFRFLPVSGGTEILKMVHGTNERVGVEDLALGVRYFIQLIRNTDELG